MTCDHQLPPDQDCVKCTGIFHSKPYLKLDGVCYCTNCKIDRLTKLVIDMAEEVKHIHRNHHI